MDLNSQSANTWKATSIIHYNHGFQVARAPSEVSSHVPKIPSLNSSLFGYFMRSLQLLNDSVKVRTSLHCLVILASEPLNFFISQRKDPVRR